MTERFLIYVFAVIAAMIMCSVSVSAEEEYDDYFYDDVEHYVTVWDREGNLIKGLYYGYIEIDDLGYHENSFGDDKYDGYKMRYRRMIMCDSDGTYMGMYTGFTRNAKGIRYYSNGTRFIGWMKFKDGWRHFDKDGYMSIGKAYISGVPYYFNDNGTWTGKLGKSGKAPESFQISCTHDLEIEGYAIGYDPEKVEIYYTENFQINSDGQIAWGETVRNITLSAVDRQVLYSVFKESNAENADLTKPFDYDYLTNFMDKNNRNKDGYIKTFNNYDEIVWNINVSVDGEKYSIKVYPNLIGQLAYEDENSAAVIFLYDNLIEYYYSLKKTYPQIYNDDE